MNDRPSSVELLRAVERFLERDVVPALDGPRRHHARVAANLVAIVAREIETEEDQLEAEWKRLSDLLMLTTPKPGSREELRKAVRARSEALAARIRKGHADHETPWRDKVVAHLRQTVDDKLAVARPPRSE